MNLFEAIVLGMIQGLTEFVPVSSTAHLLIGQKLFDLPANDAMFSYLVLVQLGTLASLIVYFWKDLIALLKAFVARPFSTPRNKLAWFIVIATLPALLAGALLKDAVEALFHQPLLEASIRLIAAALLLTLAEWLGKRTRPLESMTWWDALIIGLFQILAVFPGASRSGTTISAGMFRDLDRPSAARFAFLMSIPVMMAAGVYEAIKLLQNPDLTGILPSLVIGFLTAAIVGWLAIKWLLNYLNRRSLYLFAIYCAAGGTICLIFALL